MYNFVSTLDTPGGHMLMCFVLMFFGAGLIHFGIPQGSEIIAGSFAIMGRSMYAANGKGIVGVAMPQGGGATQDSRGTSNGGNSSQGGITVTRSEQVEVTSTTSEV